MIARRSILALGLGFVCAGKSAAETPSSIPRAALDEAPGTATPAIAVLAGGCFWGVQGVYQRTEGVLNAVSGYAGGDKWDAKYGLVSSGRTKHAEAVQITYDPTRITYARLLQIFFAVVHDPTQRDRQGPDIGPQYRSAVFPVNDEQARIARAYLAQMEAAAVFRRPIATEIAPGKAFYAAEERHQDYLVKNPRQPYILFHDMPKLAALKREFPELWRDKPVLVGAPRRLGRLGTGSQDFYRGLPETD